MDLEVRAVIPDEVVDRLDFDVSLGGDGPLTFTLVVSNRGDALWSREIPVQPVDCPYLPELAAQSFEAGLATLPRWGLPAPARPSDELGYQAFVTLPSALFAGLGLNYHRGVTPSFRWDASLDLQISAVESVERGGVQFVGLLLGTGPMAHLPVSDQSAVRGSLRVAFGPTISVGRGFAVDEIELWPRGRIIGEVGWAEGRNFRIATRIEAPLVRVAFTVDQSRSFVEPPVRLGLAFEVAGSLRKGDVQR
ncbi:MAG: hypothetical protein ABMA64_03220 [Myxococcota bacterium]